MTDCAHFFKVVRNYTCPMKNNALKKSQNIIENILSCVQDAEARDLVALTGQLSVTLVVSKF